MTPKCHNLSKLKEKEKRLKIVLRRDGKNISTDNVNRGQKAIKTGKVGKGGHFFRNLPHWGLKEFHFFI